MRIENQKSQDLFFRAVLMRRTIITDIHIRRDTCITSLTITYGDSKILPKKKVVNPKKITDFFSIQVVNNQTTRSPTPRSTQQEKYKRIKAAARKRSPSLRKHTTAHAIRNLCPVKVNERLVRMRRKEYPRSFDKKLDLMENLLLCIQDDVKKSAESQAVLKQMLETNIPDFTRKINQFVEKIAATVNKGNKGKRKLSIARSNT
jgi:hypothetical protein